MKKQGKRLLALVLAMLLALCSFVGCDDSNSKEFDSYDSDISHDTEEESDEENVDYGENALVKKEVFHLVERDPSDDDDILSSQVEYTYDTNGNMLTAISYNEEGLMRKFECTYDANDNMIKRARYDRDGEMDAWWEYEYDSAGNKTSERWYQAPDTLVSWDKYSYDEDGNLIGKKWRNDDGDWYLGVGYTYDADGKELTETRYNVDGSTSSWDESTYDTDGNLVSKTRHKKDGSSYVVVKYTCDEDGNILESRYLDDEGNICWDDEETWDATYDKSGNTLTAIHYNSDGGTLGYVEFIY